MFDIRWLEIPAGEYAYHSMGIYDESTRVIRVLQIRLIEDGKISDWMDVPVVKQNEK